MLCDHVPCLTNYCNQQKLYNLSTVTVTTKISTTHVHNYKVVILSKKSTSYPINYLFKEKETIVLIIHLGSQKNQIEIPQKHCVIPEKLV